MSAPRQPKAAPRALLRLSKTTLADLVWELAAVSPECVSCDDAFEVWRALEAAAEKLASPRDRKTIKQAIERVVAIKTAGRDGAS